MISKKAADLVVVKHQEELGNAYILPRGRFRQRPIDEHLRSQLRRRSKLASKILIASVIFILDNLVGTQTGTIGTGGRK